MPVSPEVALDTSLAMDRLHDAAAVARAAEELGFARPRIVGWGLAQAVLSAWWSFEDQGRGWEPAITCAELLAELNKKHRG